MLIKRRSGKYFQRRANVIVITAVSATMLISFAALAVDVGLLYHTKTELQRAADAAALAGAWELLLDENRLDGNTGAAVAVDNSRPVVVDMVARNRVLNNILEIDLNSGNSTDGDIVFGLLSNSQNQSDVLIPCADLTTNAVSVVTRRDSIRNGPVPLLFAQIFGKSASDVSTRATACFETGVAGYRVTPETGPAELLPFSLQVDSWEALRDGMVTSGDNYAYDPETGSVSAGSDGVLELNFYPGVGEGQLVPGNFGTVDIGNPNNSAADLRRQILTGITEADLAYIGGELSFGEDGVILLEGDTGVSAGMKDALESIKGLPRSIPIFESVTGNGDNAVFSVVRFGGIRIMYVKLTGPMAKKQVVIQPAVVVDDAVISGDGAGTSDFVSAPPRLVR